MWGASGASSCRWKYWWPAKCHGRAGGWAQACGG